MPKVILQGYILVPDTDLTTVKNELVKHIALTRAELGCLAFKVSIDDENFNKFNVYEEFVDQYAFNQHQQRVRNSTWGQVTQNVDRHYEIIQA